MGADWDDARRVLIVDDDPVLAPLLARQLEQGGFETALADGNAHALEQLRDGHYDAVVLDLRPDSSGIALLHALPRGQSAPVAIAMTGDPTGRAAVDAERAGVALIATGVPVADVWARLDDLIDKRAQLAIGSERLPANPADDAD